MIKNLLKKTEVKKNLTISIIGIGIGQLVHLGTTPIISRLYSPETFGHFSLFLSIFGILSTISLMRLELAIIVADNDEVGTLDYSLKFLGTTLTLISIISTLILYFTESEYFTIFCFSSVFLFISNRYWTQRAIVNKEKNFKSLSISKIIDSLINGVGSILIAYTSFKNFGLILSKGIGLLATYLYLKKSTKEKYSVKKESIKKTLLKYKNFPKYSFPDELIFHLNSSVAIFMFSYLFSSIEVGLIGLTIRVLSVPANFVSVSFYDVYKQKAVEDFKQFGSFRTIFIKFLIILATLAGSMILLISLTGPELFSYVFGKAWHNAGIYAQYLTILYAVKLLTGPLTFSLDIRNLHYINLIFQGLHLVLGLTIIPVVYFLTKNDILCIKYYSLILSLVSILHIFFAYKASLKELPTYFKSNL
jgi:O-antigen/teichoic acid export membrane protein